MVTDLPLRSALPLLSVAVKVMDWRTAGLALEAEIVSVVGVAVAVGVGVAVAVGVVDDIEAAETVMVTFALDELR